MSRESMDDLLRDALAAKEEPSPELNQKIMEEASGSCAGREKRKMSSVRRGIAIAAGFVLLILVLGGTVFQENVKAMVEKLFGPITEQYVYGDKEQKQQAEEEVRKVGEMITRRGIDVTLEEVLVDANKVAYCIKVHTDERWGKPLTYANIVSHVYVNGEKISDSPSSTSWTDDDHTLTCVEEVMLNSGMELKGDVDLEIRVTDICTTPAVSDQWNFRTTVNVDKANSHTTKDLTTTTMKLMTGDILVVHKVVNTSTDCKVYLTLKPGKKGFQDLELFLEGEDNLGEKIANDDCFIRKAGDGESYDVVMTFSGGFDKNVRRLQLAPYVQDASGHNYRKVGENFIVNLR